MLLLLSSITAELFCLPLSSRDLEVLAGFAAAPETSLVLSALVAYDRRRGMC